MRKNTKFLIGWEGTEVGSLEGNRKMLLQPFVPDNLSIAHFLTELIHTHLLGSVRLYVNLLARFQAPLGHNTVPLTP